MLNLYEGRKSDILGVFCELYPKINLDFSIFPNIKGTDAWDF